MSDSANSGAVIFLRLNREFFPSYALAAKKLCNAFEMHGDIDADQLDVSHVTWIKQQKESLSFCRTPEARASVAGDFLPTLAVKLCASDCMKYRRKRDLPDQKGEFQSMLIDYPDILTALQFVRDEHIRICAAKMGYLTSVNFTLPLSRELRHAVSTIRNDTREAANYAAYLHLPPLDLKP
jgi:hypothetical protein